MACDLEGVDEEALECVPEVFCEGQVDPYSSVITGYWHMSYRMGARCYKTPKYEGDDNPKEEWLGERAFPAPVSELMLQIRHPDLWDQRHEVLRMVEDVKLQRGAGLKEGEAPNLDKPLTDGEWNQVVKVLGPPLYEEKKNEDEDDEHPDAGAQLR